MNITKLQYATLEALCTKSFGYLMDAEPAYKFKEGKRTDEVVGTRVEIAVPGVDMLKVTVEEAFDKEALMGKPVTFEGFAARFYKKDGHVVETPTAKAKRLVLYEPDLMA